jgi:hypothetical protein
MGNSLVAYLKISCLRYISILTQTGTFILDSRDNNRYPFPRISGLGVRQSSMEEAVGGPIPYRLAKLPDTLETIILNRLDELKPNALSHIDAENDCINSLPREGLELARSFARIKNPLMRQIILTFVNKASES